MYVQITFCIQRNFSQAMMSMEMIPFPGNHILFIRNLSKQQGYFWPELQKPVASLCNKLFTIKEKKLPVPGRLPMGVT